MEQINALLAFLEEKWPTPLGLVSANVLALLVLALILQPLDNASAKLLINLGAILVVSVVWLIARRPRKTAKGKVGLAICLASESPQLAKRVRQDFVGEVRSLLKEGPSGKSFDVVIVPEHIARQIEDIEDAQVLLRNIRAHFILFGRVEERRVNGKPTYFLHMNGLVSHKPLPVEISRELGTEFSDLLPRRVFIGLENDVLAFDVVSRWAALVARYIVAFAAAVSGDLNYAESLYADAQAKAATAPPEIPAVQKIIARIPRRLAELNALRANHAYRQWAKDRKEAHVQVMSDRVKLIPEDLTDTLGVSGLRAISIFLAERNAAEALVICERYRHPDQPAWHFNVALLRAYLGDLQGAVRQYRRVESLKVDLDVITQVEDFLDWIFEAEPDKVQLLFCLGFFAWKVKGDLQGAKQEFDAFLKKCPATSFGAERGFAMKWIEQIDGEIQYRSTHPVVAIDGYEGE